jgi:hypothetical protein
VDVVGREGLQELSGFNGDVLGVDFEDHLEHETLSADLYTRMCMLGRWLTVKNSGATTVS